MVSEHTEIHPRPGCRRRQRLKITKASGGLALAAAATVSGGARLNRGDGVRMQAACGA